MAERTIKIESILGGWSELAYLGALGQFQNSIGIDPDFPKDDSAKRGSGLIRPTAMSDFTDTVLDSIPLWILTDPKTSNIYVYLASGKVVSYSSALASETSVATLSTSSGNGAEYYDNYHYFARNTSIDRYGPLNGSPSMTSNYWTSTLGLTALTNTTYPSINGIAIPNHHIHRHTDDKAYICDVVGGAGALHYIKTVKTTVEGDTDDNSSYQALDFDFGQYPVCTETYGTDLVVALIEGVNTTTRQKRAILAFWDTTSSSYQKIIQREFPDPLITAMKNVNGVLYVWSGSASGGVRVTRFVGGYTMEEVAYSEDGYPPLQGAVDDIMNRVIFGGQQTEPETAATVLSLGSKKRNVPMGFQSILKATSAGANPIVTACKYVLHSDMSKPTPIVGWHDDSNNGIDKISTTYGVSVWRSEVFRIGEKFVVKKIKIPLAQAVAANMTLTPTLFFDDASDEQALYDINSTNFANSERAAVYDLAEEIYGGNHNFFLQLRWTGSALLTVGLPIIIEIDTTDD